MPRRLGLLVVPLVAAGLLVGVAGPSLASPASEAAVQRRLEAIADRPQQLDRFLADLPKGADLHQHLSGAVYAESLLGWAAEQGMCIGRPTYQAYAAPCAEGDLEAAGILTNASAQAPIIANWSMRFFRPSLTSSGHDHFFSTFGLFGPVLSSWSVTGRALAEVLQQADRDGVLRQETMVTPPAGKLSAALGAATPGAASDPARFGEALAALKAAGLDATVAAARASTDEILASSARWLGCQVGRGLGCDVSVGLIAQANRNGQPDQVFAQLAVDFALAQQDSRWAGVTLVGPEDGLIALRDYTLHMRMIGYLRTQFPGVRVALHAGELVPGLVPPADLESHVRQAVMVAGAERIGHGVDIAGERLSAGTLRVMRERGVSVDIALTSNEQVLEVTRGTSQLPTYRAAGVAVSLATDDPGISRIDLTDEYRKAFRWFDLDYADLKELSYAGVEQAFVTAAERRRLLARLDREFAAFERRWSR